MSTPSLPPKNIPDPSDLQLAAPPSADDELLAALRRGDEAAFTKLVETHHAALLRLAMIYVKDRDIAEEVIQETWLGVLKGLDGFQGRASVRTWIYHILMNRAKTRALREGRTIPFSALYDADFDDGELALEPERFLPDNHPQWPGHWASFPHRWDDIPEECLLAQETREHIQEAIQELPANQQMVITLRDIEGWTSEESCALLKITESNQRVLLHRARSKVRRSLERFLREE